MKEKEDHAKKAVVNKSELQGHKESDESAEEHHESKLIEEFISRIQLKFFSGPLPPPETLEEFNRVHPEASQTIFDMFEEQVRHRMQQEREINSSKIKQAERGQVQAFSIAIFA